MKAISCRFSDLIKLFLTELKDKSNMLIDKQTAIQQGSKMFISFEIGKLS